VPVVGKVGDRLVTYFREFGKFEGAISATMKRGFLLELEMTRDGREKLSDMLTWIEKKQQKSGGAGVAEECAFRAASCALHADAG